MDLWKVNALILTKLKWVQFAITKLFGHIQTRWTSTNKNNDENVHRYESKREWNRERMGEKERDRIGERKRMREKKRERVWGREWERKRDS